MPTYKAIATTTVGAGGASSITFSSIPQTYTDLVLVYSSRGDAAGTYWQTIYTQINSSTTGYTSKLLYANEGGVGSDSSTANAALIYHYSTYASATASTFASGSVYLPNYTSSNSKSASMDSVTENNGSQVLTGLAAGLLTNTAAITSLTITPLGGSKFVQYSGFYLYGIKNS